MIVDFEYIFQQRVPLRLMPLALRARIADSVKKDAGMIKFDG